MSEGQTQDPTKVLIDDLQKSIVRRSYRDGLYLRKPKIDVMQRLASDYRDWFYAEIQDLLAVIGKLRPIVAHPTVNVRLQAVETNVRNISQTYMKKAINPMKRLAGKASKAKTEEEHYGMFKIALDNAWGLIVELRGIRHELDIMVTGATGMTLPTSPEPPRGVYG